MNKIYQYQSYELNAHQTLDGHPDPNDFRMHTHDFLEVFFILQGDAAYVVEGTEYPLKHGDVLIMRTTEAHCLHLRSRNPYERIAIHFRPELLNQFAAESALLSPFYDRPLGCGNRYTREDFRSGSYAEYLQNALSPEEDKSICELKLKVNLISFLIELNDAFKRRPAEEIRAVPKNPVTGMIDYINRHLFDQISLSSISQAFFISQTQANRLFKQSTGSTIWNYVLIKRLYAARTDILNGQNIQSVCQKCGFKDYSSFYRIYKKSFGCAPKTDRLREKNGG